MKITPEEIKASYRRMPDDELQALDRDELTEVARSCYDQEMLRRGLERKPVADAVSAGEDPFVRVERYDTAEAAWQVQSSLEAANIPARVGDPHPGAANFPQMGIGSFAVAVPASFVEDARNLLNAEAPDAIIVSARYENGVFKPLEEIEVAEGTLVELHVPSESLR
ncbi:MAG TPA: antitoxin family protein [Bryobacteraceae bacterium]|nr:antitoxin family protein [Bryobacteraceae bacterium]